MVCAKCGYKEKNERVLNEMPFCSVCIRFAPANSQDLKTYASEKVDWQVLDTFRKYTSQSKENKKEAMRKKAEEGLLVSRPPLGYDYKNEQLIQNEDASRVHSLFKTFLARNYSLNSLGKNFSLSTNGVKKVLSNRTYLGEIKFDGKIHKGNHKTIISQEVFYAVQRKLQEYKKTRK